MDSDLRTLRPGDRVTTGRPSTERPGRVGVVEEVLGNEEHPRFRIRWDDGHESIFTPAAGTLTPATPQGSSPH
jgi:rRNA processing protein Gar1